MGCFCIGLSKCEAYIRMRDYLRGKMEKRREKKRQKELERLKREVGSANDVAENSARSADVTSPVKTSDSNSRSNISRSEDVVDSSRRSRSNNSNRSSRSNNSNRSKGNVGDVISGSSDKISGSGSQGNGSSVKSGGSPIPLSEGGNFCKKVSSDSDDDDVDLTSFIQSSRDNVIIQVQEADEEDIFTTNLRLRKIVSAPGDIRRCTETPEEVRKREFLRGTASLLTAVTENPLPVIDEDSIYISKADFVLPACKISITEQRRQRDLKDGFGVFESKP